MKAFKKYYPIIRQSMVTIETSKARSDERRNQMLLTTWNNIFNYLMEESNNNYDIAVYRALYGMINDKTCKLLSWNEMKKFANSIMKGDIL